MWLFWGWYKKTSLNIFENGQDFLVLIILQKCYICRFKDASPILEAFSIFDPTQVPDLEEELFAEYGQQYICILCKQLQFNVDKTLAEWQLFRYRY